MTSDEQNPGTPSAGQQRSPWRRQAGVLGAACAGAAAVLAAWLALAPSATSYSGLSSWIVFAFLAFILVLAAAGVLFAASLPLAGAPHPVLPDAQSSPPPVPQAFPDGSYPDGSAPNSSVPEPSPTSTAGADSAAPGRSLTILGALIGAAGLALATIALALSALLPAPAQSIKVQFTDLYGRVQLEYCPTLPASFGATASHDDLAGSATILPVRISAETCGNTDYDDGVWIYLNRASITVSSLP